MLNLEIILFPLYVFWRELNRAKCVFLWLANLSIVCGPHKRFKYSKNSRVVLQSSKSTLLLTTSACVFKLRGTHSGNSIILLSWQNWNISRAILCNSGFELPIVKIIGKIISTFNQRYFATSIQETKLRHSSNFSTKGFSLEILKQVALYIHELLLKLFTLFSFWLSTEVAINKLMWRENWKNLEDKIEKYQYFLLGSVFTNNNKVCKNHINSSQNNHAIII